MDVWYLHERQKDKLRIEKAGWSLSQLSLEVVDWVKKYMEFRVEGRRRTWLESVEADMTEIEIDKEDVHDRKKWTENVMKRKSNPIGIGPPLLGTGRFDTICTAA